MLENPLILFRNWLLTILIHIADMLSSEILCSFYIWHAESSFFRNKYDVVVEYEAKAGVSCSLLMDLINSIIEEGDELKMKHASLAAHNLYGDNAKSNGLFLKNSTNHNCS